MKSLCPLVLASLFMGLVTRADQTVQTPPPRQGAALLKTDLMGIFAHPDDETGVAGTLAFYALGKGAVVANVYCTRGEGGGNMVGTQGGAALGALREAELRDCLARLGVRYCYFLDQLDWAYTESVAATLRKWGKEETLGRMVRMIRSLRPEVIVTMNPAPTPGQHGHHQAAGVLATEAYDAAADPKRFPEQLTKEGLSVWQPRKLYYGGSRGTNLTTIELAAPLPNGRTPGEIAAEALSNHRSQAFGDFGNSPWLRRPQTFTLVKSVVPFADAESDLFRGLPVAAASPKRLPSPLPASTNPPVTLEFIPRPAIANYLRWVKEQGIEHVASRFSIDVPLVAGEAGDVKLELRNGSAMPFNGELELSAPEGWRIELARGPVAVSPGSTTVQTVRVAPPGGRIGDGILKAGLVSGGIVTETSAVGHAVPLAKVPRTRRAPTLDGTDGGWFLATNLIVPPTNLVQGKVASEADSSARCRLWHDGTTLFVDVEVTDDVVVTNIAPNDIKGHWRSDSVEICLDPVGGAEDTMGCFKLGIFPFDSTGVVRAARDADANQGPIEETAPKTRLFSKRTAQGYRIQAAIPFSEIGVASAPGKRMGFNVIIYDGDKATAALGENINKSRLAWSPRSGVQGRPEDWGRIDLE
jgi:LmbE family N-acetylglucosaminyl deacetylase